MIMQGCANGRMAELGLIIFWEWFYLYWLTTFIILHITTGISESLRFEMSMNMTERIDLLQPGHNRNGICVRKVWSYLVWRR